MQQLSGKRTKRTKLSFNKKVKNYQILKLGWKLEGQPYSWCASGFVKETIRTSMKPPRNF